jgi:hypothetical protein
MILDDYLSPDNDYNFRMDTAFAENDDNGRVSFYLASRYLCGEDSAREKYVYIYATIINSKAYNILGGYEDYETLVDS